MKTKAAGLLIGAVVLIAVSFLGGKAISDRNAYWVAAGNLVQLVSLLERTREDAAQRDYISSMIHENVVWLRKYGTWIPKSETAPLKDVAARVAKTWGAIPPFRGPEWERRKADAEWVQMKKDNEEFLRELAVAK